MLRPGPKSAQVSLSRSVSRSWPVANCPPASPPPTRFTTAPYAEHDHQRQSQLGSRAEQPSKPSRHHVFTRGRAHTHLLGERALVLAHAISGEVRLALRWACPSAKRDTSLRRGRGSTPSGLPGSAVPRQEPRKFGLVGGAPAKTTGHPAATDANGRCWLGFGGGVSTESVDGPLVAGRLTVPRAGNWRSRQFGPAGRGLVQRDGGMGEIPRSRRWLWRPRP